jgi:hypothetical protein
MQALRRFAEHKPNGNPWTLGADHPAAVAGTTRYPATVKSARDRKRVLKSGMNSRKIGSHVTKGKWKGMPIYTLTLEERKTCARSCKNWLDCYGNKMHWAHRFEAGPELEARLECELKALQAAFPRGFVVRLHVLGDFYSTEYVEKWMRWLLRFPALRVFGYTSWPTDTAIGAILEAARRKHWDRFAIRLSNGGRHEKGAETIVDPIRATTAIVCPAQTGKTDCCGTCALCWQTTRNIAFLVH